ncbi:hypothetical protein ASPWEDRAFT_40183 [Aspergillus wentii DTO 134E9]|uniref:FAD-binding domain-containing protein n=1 Tax=Aspergillus wentii DTO 134E9 TaxID=1073089 RepID=A0A1L9RJE4_ASPWE|nr:uncharacterized protein ASPWEDRAFT_40183 [Aspergillus wentii DTO 134E9]KAI9931991.1 hypothetical protein MW887_009492 [Aspergillus wentii]OJJ35052.1 hypothetical protein ASPWEDRAFT_40183 [Aspergillus wentii DTO 134E9]
MPLKILISGGGIAGPALAFWLSKLGHHITIFERFPSLRASGQQIDLRGHGIEVMKRMGLEEIFRSKAVAEKGLQFVDAHGKQRAFFAVNAKEGLQSFTTDYEIMRGDLCRILYDATKDNVQYIFGVSVESLAQDAQRVNVHFSNGKQDTFDLVVGADGQSSRTRRMIVDADKPDPFRFLGLYTAHMTIPREDDEYVSSIFHAPGKRSVFTRRHAEDTIQGYLSYCGVSDELQNARDIQAQKKAWAKLFDGAGWQSNRIINAMQTDSAGDFYSAKVGQVKLDRWSRGRIVLTGDAAFCPSPMTGMGTTSALVGAYVMAGEIGRFCKNDNSEEAVMAALDSYDCRFRPFIDQVQRLAPGMPGLAFPETAWGIAILHFLMWLAVFLRVDILTSWLLGEDVKWEMPEYAELMQS